MNVAIIKTTTYCNGGEIRVNTDTLTQEHAQKRMMRRIASLKEHGYSIFDVVYAGGMYLQFRALLIDDNNAPCVMRSYEVELKNAEL